MAKFNVAISWQKCCQSKKSTFSVYYTVYTQMCQKTRSTKNRFCHPFRPLHSRPELNRFVQKTKNVKVVQICKKLTIFISSIQGPSKMLIYRSIIMARKFLGAIKIHFLFKNKNCCSYLVVSTLFNKLPTRPLRRTKAHFISNIPNPPYTGCPRKIDTIKIAISTLEGALRSKSQWPKTSLIIYLLKDYNSFWLGQPILAKQ